MPLNTSGAETQQHEIEAGQHQKDSTGSGTFQFIAVIHLLQHHIALLCQPIGPPSSFSVCLSVCLPDRPAVDLSSGNRFMSALWSGGRESVCLSALLLTCLLATVSRVAYGLEGGSLIPIGSYWVLLPSTAIGSPLLIDINGLALMELGLHKATYW
jgi:hypothetical protein